MADAPKNEDQRLLALYRYDVLDTPPEEQFDCITRLVARIFQTPISAVSLVDRQRQWFKSKVGLDDEETPRSWAFCDRTIRQNCTLVVPNALDDERFKDNPLVVDEPKIRFYAGAPLITPSGEAIGALCAIDSEAKTPTSEQLSALEDLAKLVIDQMELRRARKEEKLLRQQAEQGSLAKSNFLSRMSHEIRTPLSTVAGYADLILMSHSTQGEQGREKIEEYTGRIKTSAQELLFLLDNILDLTKLDYGNLTIENRPFDVQQKFNALAEQFRTAAVAAGLDFSFTFHTPPDLPSTVIGDFQRIRQVLSNLVANAIRFTEAGSVSIEIEAKKDTHGLFEFTCHVIDTGAGIEPAKAAHIFEIFEQVDMSTAREKDGPGLGLPIAKKLAELMNGNIIMESTPGKGSRFTFTMTLEPQHQNEKTSAPKESNGQESAALPFSSLSILLVEDNKTNAQMISAVLGTWGCKITHALNGIEALEEIDKEVPHIVLMDLHMPKMDGWTALSEIRAGQYANLQVIALTADAFEETRQKCLDHGFDSFISKPIDWAELYRVIFESIAQTDAAKQAS